MKIPISLILSGILLSGCSIEVPENANPGMSDEELQREARRLADELIIIDTHIDTPYRMEETESPIDLSVRSDEGDFDFPRAREGGLNAAFMSIYIPASFQETGGAREKAEKLIDRVESFESRWPDQCAVARSPQDVRDHFEKGLISLPMGMENGAALENDLANLEHFYNRGIRYITLTHSKANQICDSSYDPERKWNGLSPFGKKVVAEMNRLGIMIDISHVTDDTFRQVVELSRTPVIASHSSCRYFTPGWERNMSDELIRKLAEKGGIIQINFGAMFLDNDYLQIQNRLFDQVRGFMQKNHVGREAPETRAFVEKLRLENPIPEVDVSRVVEHIDHVVEIAGIDHLGIGSDFDGVGDAVPVGLEDVSCYPNLIFALLKVGYSKADLRKICGENLLRVWEKVEDYAASARN